MGTPENPRGTQGEPTAAVRARLLVMTCSFVSCDIATSCGLVGGCQRGQIRMHYPSKHNAHYATLRGETPQVGVTFAKAKSPFTAIWDTGESELTEST